MRAVTAPTAAPPPAPAHAPPPAAAAEPAPRLALAGLFLLALVLRLWGIHFGFPYMFHFDEPSYLHMAYRFTFENFHPMYGSLFGPMQLLVMAEHEVFEWLRPLLAALPLSPELRATVDSPITSYNLLARWTSALLGALTVVPVYRVGDRLWGRRAGLLAAAMLAVCFLHVRSSHYGVPDATAAFFTAMAADYALRLGPAGRWRDHLLAGLFAGLALTAKLLLWPVLLLPALAVAAAPAGSAIGGSRAAALGRRLRRLLSPRLLAAYAVAAAAALATMPQLLVETEAVLGFWRQASMIGRAGGLGHFRLDDGGPAWTYLYTLLWGTGAAMTAAILAGLALAAVRPRSWREPVLLAAALLYVLFLFRPGNVYHSRYLVAVMPLLVPFGAAAAVRLLEFVAGGRLGADRWEAGRRQLAWALAALVLCGQPLVSAVRHDVLLTRPDTRTLAKQWIETNVPEGRRIAVETAVFSPPLAAPQRPLPLSSRVYDVKSREIFGLSALRQDASTVGSATAGDYRAAGVDYLITNSFISGFRMLDPELDRRMQAFYDSLETAAERVATFAPTPDGAPVPRIFTQNYGPATDLWTIERPGPEIRIYRLRADP